MKLIFIILLLSNILFCQIEANQCIGGCPNGEFLRVTRYGPRGPYLLCTPIPQGKYCCGYIEEATYNGKILIDRLCDHQCKVHYQN